ncbi:hypothetical protein CORC01_01631 [Colletotrichum orchidophilum]|uniref:Uncharacterized protein n=1 Tax=Colletotrichum orchidophilum TaxID=1209926 RepID=A0A1G4BPK4_9PEZI|nr:uncharacterized protein CORC01_01631 [Colletotrichum orchidophilum]OHF03247.1 hypothetical protein CORC01_01631 [Colletotrichum orchidophilum]
MQPQTRAEGTPSWRRRLPSQPYPPSAAQLARVSSPLSLYNVQEGDEVQVQVQVQFRCRWQMRSRAELGLSSSYNFVTKLEQHLVSRFNFSSVLSSTFISTHDFIRRRISYPKTTRSDTHTARIL